MPSYAGAKAAIEAQLKANWSDTPIAVMNGRKIEKTNGSGQSVPWVFFSIEDAGSTQRGAGSPGNNVFVYDGLIAVDVFVPIGTGTAVAASYADRIGEIFRNREFYNETPGFCVRSWAPRVDSGGDGSDDGLWFRVGMTCPFEYWHRG